MPDRLLVACVLWSRGIKAEYCFQDLWRKRRREGGMVELSVEEATTVCLTIGIPYLVMIKAHVLREKQAVKLRAVREGGYPIGLYLCRSWRGGCWRGCRVWEEGGKERG